jgi:hypothetical protein
MLMVYSSMRSGSNMSIGVRANALFALRALIDAVRVKR